MVPVSSPRSFCRKVGSQVLAPQYAASVRAETSVRQQRHAQQGRREQQRRDVARACGAPARCWRSASQVSDSGT